MIRDVDFERRFQARYAEAKAISASLEGPSLAERFVALPPEQRQAILSGLTVAERASLAYCWAWWSRPKQRLPFGTHRLILWMLARAAGKNRSGSERIREHVARGARSLVIIGATHRETLRYMVGGRQKGGSGILDVFPPEERARIEVKEMKGEIHLPGGAVIYFASDEAPEALRGGNYEVAWIDELAKYRHAPTVLENLEFAMRVRGAVAPEIIVTTTPRPSRVLKEIIADPDTLTIVGTSDENAANLDPRFIARLESKYGGSRIARQERGGELLDDAEGALFSASMLDAARVEMAPDLVSVVIAVDPAIATGRDNDATGLVAMGRDARGHIFILEDASAKASPEAWGAAAVRLYAKHRADAFCAERNRGGDLVRANLNAAIRQQKGPNATAKVVEVWATRGKHVRAEPVATLAEQGRLHVVGVMPALEDELTSYSPGGGGPSPNRLDAVVWGAWFLANLSDETEEKPDPKLAFVGLEAMARAVTAPAGRSPRTGHSLTELLSSSRLGWSGGGGRI